MEQSKDEQFVKMTQCSMPKLITSLSIPTVISMLVTAIYNITDTYFVSQLGTSASAAVGVVFSIMSIIQAVGFGLGMGSGSLVSRLLGKHDDKSASKYASTGFLSAFIFGSILMIIGLTNINWLMRILGSTETILPYSRSYGRIILAAAPIMCSAFVLNNILRSQGKTMFSMIGLTIGGVFNVILDPLFIFVLDMGISGAAAATVISQCLSFCVLSSFYLRGKSIVKISLHNVSKNYKDFLLIIRTGIPTVCRQGFASLATALLNVAAANYGDAAVAAMSIATRIYLFVRNIVIGIGQGFQPVAGYNYGAKKYERVKEAFWVTVKAGTIVVFIAAIIVALNAESIITIFRADDEEVIKIGTKALYFICASFPLLAYSTYVNQMLQTLGYSKSATFLASSRQGIFFVPLILILPIIFGLVGVQAAQPVADIITAIISVPFHVNFFKHLNKISKGDKFNENNE